MRAKQLSFYLQITASSNTFNLFKNIFGFDVIPWMSTKSCLLWYLPMAMVMYKTEEFTLMPTKFKSAF
jgi:hypothetical protein